MIHLRIPSVPVAQPRIKARAFGGRAQIYTPSTIKTPEGGKRPHPIHAFKATVKMVASERYTDAPLRGPVRVDIICVFPRQAEKIWKSKPMPRYPHTAKPDRDNLDKAVLDALKGIVLSDDAQVCDGRIQKFYAAGDEQPHVDITIEAVGAS